MADFSAIKSFFLSRKLHLLPEITETYKAIIRHLTSNTPTEEIYKVLVDLGFDIISIKQMTTTCQSPAEDPEKCNLPLFLITYINKRGR